MKAIITICVLVIACVVFPPLLLLVVPFGTALVMAAFIAVPIWIVVKGHERAKILRREREDEELRQAQLNYFRSLPLRK